MKQIIQGDWLVKNFASQLPAGGDEIGGPIARQKRDMRDGTLLFPESRREFESGLSMHLNVGDDNVRTTHFVFVWTGVPLGRAETVRCRIGQNRVPALREHLGDKIADLSVIVKHNGTHIPAPLVNPKWSSPRGDDHNRCRYHGVSKPWLFLDANRCRHENVGHG